MLLNIDVACTKAYAYEISAVKRIFIKNIEVKNEISS